MLPNFAIIFACDQNRGIGKNNDLPWHLPEDLKYFRETTEGSAVIMGRKTWESIPEQHRPFKNRINIVVSHQSDYPLPEGVHLAGSLDEALQKAADLQAAEIFNIGGAQLFNLGLQHTNCTQIYVTRIQAEFDCDTFLDPIPKTFQIESESELKTSKTGLQYKYQILQHRPGAAESIDSIDKNATIKTTI